MKDFKFGIKVKPKTVGDFNVGNPEEWTMLIKPQFKDDTLFVHFHCLFQHKLTQEEIDEGKSVPLKMSIITGFMKEGCFCPISKNDYNSDSKDKLVMSFERYLIEFYEQGYIKHSEMYLGSVPDEPTYRKYEGGASQSALDIQKMMQTIGLQMPGVTTPNPGSTQQKAPKIMILPMRPTSNPNP